MPKCDYLHEVMVARAPANPLAHWYAINYRGEAYLLACKTTSPCGAMLKAEADGDQRIFASMTRLIRRNMRISTLFLVNPQVAPKTPLGRIEPRRGT